MDDLKAIPSDSSAQVSWSKTVRKEDGSEIRISVEKIDNGFLQTTNYDGKNAKGEWEYKTEKKFLETNPFEEDEKKEEKELSLVDKLGELFK